MKSIEENNIAQSFYTVLLTVYLTLKYRPIVEVLNWSRLAGYCRCRKPVPLQKFFFWLRLENDQCKVYLFIFIYYPKVMAEDITDIQNISSAAMSNSEANLTDDPILQLTVKR